MNDRVRSAAIEVMDAISSHPAANDFLEPFQPTVPEEQNYFERIRDPQDLGTIKGRLVHGHYISIQPWLKDVETVWTNAISYHSDKPHVVAMAAHCRRLFDKYRRRVDVLSMGTWCGEVYRLRTRVYDLMNAPPAKVKQYASSLGAAHTMKQNMPALTEREIQNFVTATEMMSREEDHDEMLRIIDEIHPEIDSGSAELILDVTKMNTPTIYALRDYMKTTLEKRGQKYTE
jgi:hypothetical protein